MNISSGNSFNHLITLRSHIALQDWNTALLLSYTRNDTKEKMLTGSVSSLGVVNKNYYRMLNESGLHTPGHDAVYPYENFQWPFFVTGFREQYFNGTRNENLAYNYENAVIHKQGLGFRGFEKITTNDRVRDRSWYQKFDPFSFSVLKEEDSPAAKFTCDYSFNVASNKIAKVRLTNRSVQDKLKGITVTSAYTYDTYGNPLTETIDYSGGITETVSNIYSNNTNEASYLLGFLYDRTKTINRNGSTWTERYYVPAYNNGQPSVAIRYANGNQVSQETFLYDLKGNNTSHSLKSYSSTNTLTTTYDYDSYGRITRVIDPLGFNTTYEYNVTKGSLSKVKNHKSQEIIYGYDAFGRRTTTSYPEGSSESITYSWTNSGTNRLYRIQSSQTGNPLIYSYYDALNRETRSSQIQFNSTESHIDKLYDNYGRLQKTSLPFTGSSASLWDQYTYDRYDRPTSITEASGRITSYSYSNNSVTTTKDGIASTQTFDTQGNLTQVTDPGGTITYNLRPDKQPASIVTPGSITTSFTYDNYGRKSTIVDPSAGTQTYTYDIHGNIATEKDANNKTISYGYDIYRRLITKTCPEFTVHYRYNSDGLLRADSINSARFTAYSYDTYGKLYKEKEMVPDGKWLEKTYSYTNSNLQSTQYASQTGNIVTENYYYNNGALSEIKLNGTTSIWKLNTVNAFGQPTSATTSSINRSYGFNSYGLPTDRTAGSFQNHTYSFDVAKGNLNNRKDNTRNIQENFTYDNLNRLTGYAGNSAAYDTKGNLTSRSDVGTFQYNTSGKPYAISGLTASNGNIPTSDQTMTYTSFKRLGSITGNGEEYTANFTYNGSGSRVKMEQKKNGTKDLNRYYLSGCYEIDDRAVGGIREKLYLGGDFYTAPAVYVKEGSGNWNIHYICRDYLGSITHITNSSGSVVQELSYDAWGRLRNPLNQLVYAAGNEPELFLGRGYTGHEHLTRFGLINMNARLYDPAAGRFLSPDPYIQDPLFSLNYDRYSYCLNNPLSHTDPDGEFWQFIVAAIFSYAKNAHDNTSKDKNSGNPTNWQFNPGKWENTVVLNAGYNTGGNWNANGGFGNTSVPVPIFGYDSQQGLGIGFNYNGNTSMYYPNYDNRINNSIEAWGRSLTWETVLYSTPVYGSCMRSSDAYDSGGYLDAASEFGIGVFEMFTFGGGTEITQSVKMAGNSIKAGFNTFRIGSAAKGGTNVLSKSELLRIENAATRINKPINVVGSRATGKAGAYSDWDYVIEGINSRNWSTIKNSLPGARSILDNTPRNIDLFRGPLDLTKPYITIYSRTIP